MITAVRLWWLLTRHEQSTSRLPTVLAVTAFAVAGGSLLVVLGGVHAMFRRWAADPSSELGSLYLTLAVVAAALMVIPILTLGGQAARLTLARRNHRLATLRLAGATTGQSATITVAETTAQALAGSLIGTALYGLTLPVLTLISFEGRPLQLAELWLGPGLLLAGLAAVVALALVSAMVSLGTVAVTPLGVASRVTPKRLTVLRAVVVVAMMCAWPLVLMIMPMMGVILFGLGLVAVVNLIGPWLVMLFGMVLAGLARRAPTLLAARRIVDDPRTAWRSASAFALVIMLATGSAWASHAGAVSGESTLSADMSTGALITLVIVSVVAATSSGVVHACRVIDNQSLHQSMVLAGTEVSVLSTTRLREVAWPLAVTTVTAGGFAALLMMPLGYEVPVALARFAIAVGGSAVLTLLALWASHPLLVRSVQQPAAG
ncbi:hypothetical protein ACQBAU_17395 [Propionibacteriaceae bacterium Y2011]